ncbi:hypothetical protein B0H19DRAFT_1079783 [Mycena capillaripes]|nr:hypothetical protein B0H19DRAFT_1079783 [Mycena capillaripes]
MSSVDTARSAQYKTTATAISDSLEVNLDRRDTREPEINAIIAVNWVTGKLLAHVTQRRRKERRSLLFAGHAVKGVTTAETVPRRGAGAKAEGTGVTRKISTQKLCTFGAMAGNPWSSLFTANPSGLGMTAVFCTLRLIFRTW